MRKQPTLNRAKTRRRQRFFFRPSAPNGRSATASPRWHIVVLRPVASSTRYPPDSAKFECLNLRSAARRAPVRVRPQVTADDPGEAAKASLLTTTRFDAGMDAKPARMPSDFSPSCLPISPHSPKLSPPFSHHIFKYILETRSFVTCYALFMMTENYL